MNSDEVTSHEGSTNEQQQNQQLPNADEGPPQGSETLAVLGKLFEQVLANQPVVNEESSG